jgi:hypothetical protein
MMRRKMFKFSKIGTIYRLARSTIIFWGEATPETPQALDGHSSPGPGSKMQVPKMLANILASIMSKLGMLRFRFRIPHLRSKNLVDSVIDR